METIAQKELRSQEELVKLEQEDIEQYVERTDPEEFWEEIGRRVREGIRVTIEKTISREFSQFIGALEYERSPERKDVRNGHRSRDIKKISKHIYGETTVLLLYLDSTKNWEKLFPFGLTGLLRRGLSTFT